MLPAQKINVYGAGYVGLVTALRLAEQGHVITLVDSDDQLLSELKDKLIRFTEDDLKKAFLAHFEKLSFISPRDEVPSALAWYVCVGTPERLDGRVDLEPTLQAILDIGGRLSNLNIDEALIFVRSTIPPGTLRDVLLPALESRAQSYFNLFHYPEFLREGKGMVDAHTPNIHILGTLCDDGFSASKCIPFLASEAPLTTVKAEESEFLKYSCNAFHALKVAFANEMGALAQACSVDGQKWSNIFCSDRRLNISDVYLKPGFAFGGPCLKKDIRGLLHLAEDKSIQVPLLAGILPSNDEHITRALRTIKHQGPFKRIGMLGVAFKPETGDFRGSSLLQLAKHIKLADISEEIWAHDNQVSQSTLSQLAPYLNLVSEDDLMNCDAIVLGSKAPSAKFLRFLKDTRATVIDLQITGIR